MDSSTPTTALSHEISEFIKNLTKNDAVITQCLLGDNNCDITLYELTQFLLSIISDEKINEAHCAFLSSITKKEMSADLVASLRSSVNTSTPFYSLRLLINADISSEKKDFILSKELVHLFETIGSEMVKLSENKKQALENKNRYIQRMQKFLDESRSTVA